MLQRTNKLLIGKDIDRDADLCVDGASLAAFSKTTGIEDGEILVLDKNKLILAEGKTIADTDIIYLCQGTGETYSYANEAGTLVSSVRKVIFSDPIEGAKVKSYKAKTYVAKAEKTAAVTLTGVTPAAGTEYIIRIIYKDIPEHPGQFTQTYRHVATAATAASVATLSAALVKKVNSHKGRRVTATDDTTGLTLTGLPIPECCTSLNDIDEFSMVDFEVRFLYVDTAGNWQVIPSTSTVVTYLGPTSGSGNWEQIRDIEKGQLGYVGITNRTMWPVKSPDLNTVVGGVYDMIIIEHDRSYLSPDNQYIKQAPLTTVLALATAANGINTKNQAANVLARLNGWMASLPQAFNNIAI